MNTIKIAMLLALAALFLCPACQVSPSDDDDDPTPPTPNLDSYEDGIFISHQGNPALNINSSVSFRDRATSGVVDSIYQQANSGAVLPPIHSMQLHDGRIYLISNSENQVVVVAANSFQRIGTINNLQKPRYLLPIGNNKACISEWGEDGISGRLSIVDLNSLQISNSIPTRPGPEQMLLDGNHLYVVNNGGFALDSVVSKVSLTTEEVLETIKVGLAPNSLQIDQNGHLWVLCQGIKDPFVPSNNRNGELVRLENDELQFRLELAPAANNLVISPDGSRLYFVNQEWLYAHGLGDTSLSLTPFIASPFSHIAVHPNTGDLYCVDPRNLQSDGSVLVFSGVGALQYTFQTSVAPNGFGFME
ncbi:MAG: DUF5074 domain-containing protein [Bacteroidota bacterium]